MGMPVLCHVAALHTSSSPTCSLVLHSFLLPFNWDQSLKKAKCIESWEGYQNALLWEQEIWLSYDRNSFFLIDFSRSMIKPLAHKPTLLHMYKNKVSMAYILDQPE